MSAPSFFERLRSTRIVQVVVVYLGASWAVLQIVDTLQGLLTLPEWVGPVAVLLLLVGLIVVLATAWVQSLPQTTAAEEAGEVPTDWEVAPADALKSLSRGRIPHLTWGRAILGGVFALSLLFGIAGVTVLVRGPGGALVGPQAAGASSVAEGIAVLPFHASGDGMDVYREGMVDLMSANLDGLSRYRTVDSRTLLARWNREVGEATDVELDQALRVAGALGARYAIVGAGVDVGSQVRFTATVYDVADGSQIGTGARVEGPEEEVLGLIDALTVDVVRELLSGSGESSQAQTLRLASLLTESVPALRHFLEGDALYRRAMFSEARDAFQNALAEDSTFALAYWRLGDTYGWMESVSSPRSRQFRQRAADFSDRLPERERTLLAVQNAIVQNAVDEEAMTLLRDYLERFPDDPDGWYLVGEAGLHAWTATGVTDAELEEALYRTVELDPTFGPYYEHALHWATAKGHAERYESLVAGAESVGAQDRLERMRLRWALFQGDEPERAAAEARVSELEQSQLLRIDQVAIGLLDAHLERLEPLLTRHDRREALRVRLYGEQGRLAEMVQLAENSGEGDVIGEAVTALTDWMEASDVPEELVARLDRAVGPITPDDVERFGTRQQLDAAMGRPTDRDVELRWLNDGMDEFLPQMSGVRDTVGVRDAILASVDAQALSRQGRTEEAYEALASPMSRTRSEPPTGFTILLARLALDAGELDEAIRALEGVSRSQNRSLVKFRLGVAYEARGDTAKALDAYRTFLSRAAPADEQLGAVIEAREAVTRLGG